MVITREMRMIDEGIAAGLSKEVADVAEPILV